MEKNITISTEYIKLEQLLKLTHLIPSGGAGKIFLACNKVLVNGIEEKRRGRKLYVNDKIIIKNQVYVISEIKEESNNVYK